jgi:GT2 family glycosyltransferase
MTDSNCSQTQYLFLVSHFNNTHEIVRFIEHVKFLAGSQYIEFAIADNSGNWSDDSLRHSNIMLCTPNKNLGYLGGCRFALEQWTRNSKCLPEWIVFLNTDLEFAPDFFQVLQQIQVPSDVGVVAPYIYLETGVRQNPYKLHRPSRLRMLTYIIIYRSPILTFLQGKLFQLKRLLKSKSKIIATESHSQEIYAAHGSMILLRRSFFDNGGTLEYKGFMFAEEFHIAEQARRIGLKIIYIPTLKVLHREHAALKNTARTQKRQWAMESMKIIWKDYFLA